LACAIAFFVCSNSPADAHNCAKPVTIPAGHDSPVDITVTIGDTSPSAITVRVPSSMTIVSAAAVPGWTIEQHASSVTYTGGATQPNGCAMFPLVVRADGGSYSVRAVQRLPSGDTVEHPANGDVFLNADGTSTVVDYSGPPNPAFEQVIFVTGSSSSGGVVRPIATGVAIGLVLCGGFWLALRLRDRRRLRT
jgi:hypothetical protein